MSIHPNDPEALLGARAVADLLGIHENTVRNLEARGELPAARLPGSGYRRFRRSDIERMRREMLSQFAPATEMPEPSAMPHRRVNP